MAGFPILTAILLTPVAGIVLLALLPRSANQAVKLMTAAVMSIALGLTLYVYKAYDAGVGGLQFVEQVPWIKELGVSYSLGVDGFSLPVLLLTLLVVYASIFASWDVHERPKEFFIHLLLLIVGAVGTFISQDLFIFLLFYELGIVPSYLLVLGWGSEKRVSKEYAGMKLTIYLLLGSAFMLAGVVLLYLYALPEGLRSFNMAALAQAAGNVTEPVQIIAFFFLLLGFGSTLSMWPFYSWAPDGYAAAPTGVSMIHAGVLKKVGAYGLIRLGLLVLPAGVAFWAPFIALFAVANIVYAAFVAIAQQDLKYVVAYSSISHIGYILLGVAALNLISLDGAIANMVAHGLMSALFFAMIGLVEVKTKTRHIPDLGGLAHQLPRIAAGLMLAGMSSLGLPGLIGFVPEFTIFLGAFRTYPVYTLLAISGIVFTALYILRLLANVLFGPRKAEFDQCRDASGVEMVPLVVLGSVLVLFGVFPQWLMGMVNSGMEPAWAQLMQHLPAASALLGGVFQ